MHQPNIHQYNIHPKSNNELEINNDVAFQPNNIVNCFKSIHHYLTPEQVSYFCSPWWNATSLHSVG